MGAIALAGYIATIGVATYLLKASLEDLSPYQINLLMGVAILAVSLPAVLLTEESLQVARRHLSLGALVALLMAAGSVFYAIALGIALTIAGVAILSWRA